MLGDTDCLPLTAFMASTIYTSKLHKLFPHNFAPLTILDSPSSSNELQENSFIIRGYPGLVYNLLPNRTRGIEPLPFDQNNFNNISSFLQHKLQEEIFSFWSELDGDNPESNLAKSLLESILSKENILANCSPQETIFNKNDAITFLGIQFFLSYQYLLLTN